MPGGCGDQPADAAFYAPLDAMPVGVFVLDKDYLVRFWNRTLAGWTRVPPAAILGTDVRLRYPGFFDDNVLSRLATVFRGGPPAVFSAQLHGSVIPCRLPSGARRLQQAMVTALRREGDFLALFSLQDVTDTQQRIQDYVRMRDQALAQRAAELERLARRLMELDRMKSAFLSSIQHEMRTPLTAIVGFAKVVGRTFAKRFAPLAAGDPDLSRRASQVAANLDIIVQESCRLTDRINDVLELTRLQDGSLEWNDHPHRLGDLVREALEATAGAFGPGSGLVLETDLAEGLPDVRVDRVRFTRLLVHLLDNAARFTGQGRVRVAVRVGAGIGDGPGAIQIEVSDTGPGIPEAELERIFQPFHQVTAGGGLEGKPSGHGLGLAVVRAVAEHYGGSVRAVSAPGQGAAFILAFPESILA